MNAFVEFLNLWGERFVGFVWPMLWQSSLLIAALFAFDFALRRRIRASVRYALWLVVLVKLLLPPSLALPTSLAWWVRPPAPVSITLKQEHSLRFLISYSDAFPTTVPIPAAPVFEPPPKPSLSPGGRAALGWVAICAGLLTWLLVRWWQVVRDVRRSAPASERLNELLTEARKAAGVSRRVKLRLTTRAMSPAVCGLFRPVILLPQSLVARLTSEQLRTVLLHEVIHLRRGDVWVNCLQALLQIFYWWHPLLWLANARIRHVREEAVDDAVMLTLAEDAEAYAPTLIEVAKLAFNRPLASLGLVGILESRSVLRQRIERLVDFHPPKVAGVSLASVLCTLTFAALAVPMAERPINSLTRNTQDKLAEQRNNNANLTPISNFIGEFEISGEKADSDVTFTPDTGIATASNGASARYRGVTVTADRIVVDSRAKTITADGHVRFARDANAGERSLGDHMLLTAEGETVTVKGSNFRSTGTAAESALVPEFTTTFHAPHSNETKGAMQVSTQKQTRFASPPVELSNENEEVKLRMILLNKLVTGDAVQKRKLAEDIIAKVRGGAAFSEMASVFSEDRQGRQGGDWGWVQKYDRNGALVLRKELADAAFSLKPGEVSGVIETPEVICLMLVEDRRPGNTKTLSEAPSERRFGRAANTKGGFKKAN